MIEHAAGILSRAPSIVTELVRRSVVLKAGVVAEDEHEGGRRAILNAGHTLAHAIEQASDYLIPHGEAVAIGLVLETRMAEYMHLAATGTADHLARMFAQLSLPHELPPVIDRHRVLAGMESDKKNRGGIVRAALLSAMGQMAHSGPQWTFPIDLPILRTLL
jgi:3-dehydroquinate synthase